MSRELHTLCPYCGVGCGLLASTDGQKVTKVRGDPQHPANFGRLCPKGATVAQTVDVKTRLRRAMLRTSRDQSPAPVSPAEAITHVSEKLKKIIAEHGPESVALYLSGQMTTESQYVFNKFGKGILRTNHVDSNSRLCMSSAANGMALSLGSDGPPASYADIELADAFFFIGSNAAECHPVTFARVRKRIEKSRAECIVVDPRKTLTAESATLHLPIKPGTDLALLNGLLYLLHKRGRIDKAFIAGNTEGWEALEALLPEYTPDAVAKICGVPVYSISHAAHILEKSRSLISFWTMGVNQSSTGTFTSNAIINLHLATGQIGRPGCGPFSLTGQPNAMGGRDVGYMSHQLPGQRKVSDPEHRRQMEGFWGLEPGTIRPHAGYDAVKLFDAMERGEVKALWIVGTNPAASMPNLPRIRAALEKAELVIVQDAYYPTETTRFADVLLPASVHLEQSGTFCNSERRVSLMEQVVPPPGDAKPDWWWPCEVACAMGLSKGMSFGKSEAIFDEFARSTAGRPNDQSALTHALLKAKGPQQWPYPALGQTTARRYEDGQFCTLSGRAKFWARPYTPIEETPNRKFPLLLTTGRVAGQWHTRTKTGLVAALNSQDPAPYLQIHPDDAAELGITPKMTVEIESVRGKAMSVARLDPSISPGTVFLPIHWNDLWAVGSSPNEATIDATDPISLQPALKHCAVIVRPKRYLEAENEGPAAMASPVESAKVNGMHAPVQDGSTRAPDRQFRSAAALPLSPVLGGETG